MGNYALKEHLIARLGSELLDDLTLPNMPLTLDEYLEFMIEDSEGLIDGYIAKYYGVPVTTNADNGFLRGITLDLTEYQIWKRAVGDDVPTKYKTSYDAAMQVLRDIADGKLAPFNNEEAGNSSIDLISDTRVMGEDELRYY